MPFLGCITTYLLMVVFVIANNAGCATAAVRLLAIQCLLLPKRVLVFIIRQRISFFSYLETSFSLFLRACSNIETCLHLSQYSCWLQPSLLHRCMLPAPSEVPVVQFVVALFRDWGRNVLVTQLLLGSLLIQAFQQSC